MFYDAVFAIVLTLLVLDLHLLKEGIGDSPSSMGLSVMEMAPQLLAFLLSVALVGGSWVSSVNTQQMMVCANFGTIVPSVISTFIAQPIASL